MKKILPILLLLLFPVIANAQVVINEFYVAETSGDWVELYSVEDVDISGWILRDNATSKMHTIPNNTSIGPTSSLYYIAEVGNRLNMDTDSIRLLKQDDSFVVDQVSYGTDDSVCAPSSGQSAGRYPDGNATIERFTAFSKGETNDLLTLDPCPTPTPTPTIVPTSTPRPTSSPKPTSTPKPTVTPKKTSTPKSTLKNSKKTANTKPADVLGLGEDIKNERLALSTDDDNSNEESEVDGNENKKKFPIAAVLLIVGGAGFIGIASFPFVKEKIRILKAKDNEDK